MIKFGDKLIASMPEALAHARGENVPGMVVHEVDVDNIDPRAIRLRLRLVERLKAGGPNWQSRANDLLRKAVGL